MKLTLGEKLMVLRSRKGLSKKALGQAVFDGIEHPNVKMHKIEAGRQKVSKNDLDRICDVLGIKKEELTDDDSLLLSPIIIEAVPEFGKYVKMLNEAAMIGDPELVRSTLESFAKKILP
jgi:hypothetical protein